MTRNSGRSGWLFALRMLLGAALVALPLAGCSDVLDVKDVDVVSEEALDDPEQLPLLHATAIGNFARSYSGSFGEAGQQVIVSGIFADEFFHSSNVGPDRRFLDRRAVTPSNFHVVNFYQNLHRARVLAERAAEAFAAHNPGTAQHAEVHNLAGYVYLFFAENFCSGVPFTEVGDGGALIYGMAESRAQILDRAAAHFNAALAMNASADMNNLARVGLGRSLLFRGTAADHSTFAAQAATAVAGVPAAFQYVIFHSLTTGSQNNGIWDWVNNDEVFSLSTLEGTNGLDFRADPRVPNRLDPVNGRSSDGTSPQHQTLKYATATSPVPLATGTEAELIRAEADLRAGNFASALTRLNALRAGGGLAPLADPGTPAARENLLFSERAFWLWGTGHRLGDLRRLIRQYGRTEDGVFPTGLYEGGPVSYGDDVNLPVPVAETANPAFTGCINREA